jgi:hypothetical protein
MTEDVYFKILVGFGVLMFLAGRMLRAAWKQARRISKGVRQ